MKDKHTDSYKCLGPIAGPEATLVSWGLILRAPLERIPEIKRVLLEQPDARIVFQMVSPAHLRIVEE